MHKSVLFFLLSLIFIFSCDDGDVITFELDFEENFEACEGVSNLVLYKTKDDPSESISVLIANYTIAELIDVGEDNILTEEKLATLYYRTYSDLSLPNNLFCNDIPPKVNTNVNEESSCEVVITTRLVEDDNDGVPASLEFDGDTDKDGLPNSIDADDDGDNILTKDENPDPNGDNDLSDAQDTDGDGTPDYLDADDDDDGVLTRDEESILQNQNPADDITNSDVGPDYLNRNVCIAVPAIAYRPHTILKTFTVSVNLTNFSLTTLSQDILDFGVLESSNIPTSSKTTTQTPKFLN